MTSSALRTTWITCDWVYDDGGRAAAGYEGDARDCVTRAIAIATGMPYKHVHNLVDEYGTAEQPTKRQAERRRGRKSTVHTGVFKLTTRKLMADLGWRWTPLMGIGTGCRVHLCANELPGGPLIAQLSKHVCAVMDLVIHDTHDPSRGGERCVYGVFLPPGSDRIWNASDESWDYTQ